MTGFAVIMRRFLCQWMTIAVVGIVGVTVRAAQDGALVPVPDAPSATLPPVEPSASDPDSDKNAVTDDDALLRGPVHEAFAEQFNQDPVEGLIVPRQPPEPVEELAPDVRPDGRQIEWISGYWAWDDDTQDFFWVSGIWREVPQGFRWIPGYWTEAAGGWQWVSGTWVSVATEELAYIETAPPQSLESGPIGVAPASSHIWIPGCWQWNTNRYAWRPGYWSGGYSNWCWVPARYVWTPRGYFFSNGYWDYPLARRGMLFAPYRFRNLSRWSRGYRFTPQVVIATNLIQLNFWVRPRYRHYYFGDYYNNAYLARGFQPWHRFHSQQRQFDPLFAYTSHLQSVGGRNYFNRLDQRFGLLTQNPDRRPIHSFSHQNRQLVSDRFDDANVRAGALGSTLQDHLRNTQDARFVRLEQVTRERAHSESNQIREIAAQRREFERAGSTREGNGQVLLKSLPQARKQENAADTHREDSTLPRAARNHGEVRESKTLPDQSPDQKSARLRLPAARNTNPETTGTNAAVDANPKSSVQRRVIHPRSGETDTDSPTIRSRAVTPGGRTLNPAPDRTRRGSAEKDSTLKLQRTFEPRSVDNDPGKTAPVPRLETLRKTAPETTKPPATLPRTTTPSPLRDPALRGSVNRESTPLRRRMTESRTVPADANKLKPLSPQAVAPRATLPMAAPGTVPRRNEIQPSHSVPRRAVESRPAPGRPENPVSARRIAAPKAPSITAPRREAGQAGSSKTSRPDSPSARKSGGSGRKK